MKAHAKRLPRFGTDQALDKPDPPSPGALSYFRHTHQTITGNESPRLEIARFRRTLAGLALPSAADGRLVLAVDVSP
ncbi:hypothetical protein [Frankia sp. EAN1pec]|uniref:hypothetical protein n=1 Tax=Parafrankia sp. (strain EAN1pec) TaxID=298653 RepID=UPI0012FA31E9